MKFRRLKLFTQAKWGGILFKWPEVLLVDGHSHYGQIVKVGDQYRKTEYTHVRVDADLKKEIYEATEPLTLREIRKLRHHFTRRIWIRDGVFECINWQVLNKQPEPKHPKLLPPDICYDCMLEGDKYIPKQLKSNKIGLCRCCGETNIKLYPIRLGWPLDLRHKGFGFTVIGSGINWELNKERYKREFDMSIYSDYKG